MTDLDITLESSVAFITRTSPRLIETRFKENVLITSSGIMENIRIRREMCQRNPHVMLSVACGDHDIESSLMRTDFFMAPEDRAIVKAIALVVDTEPLPQIARMYFRFFPQTFRTGVFQNEQEARDWLSAQADAEFVP